MKRKYKILVYKKVNDLGDFKREKAIQILYELRDKHNHSEGEFRVIMKDAQSSDKVKNV